MKTFLLYSVALLLLIGCSIGPKHVYLGPKRPVSELARIYTIPGPPLLGIDRVDRKSVISFPDTPAGEVYVIPGQHVLFVRATFGWGPMRSYATGVLHFDARAGENYRVSVNRRYDDSVVFFLENNSGKIVDEYMTKTNIENY